MAALGEDLLTTVNKLQDLVFNTIGTDSLDLPQIVSFPRATRSFHLTNQRSRSSLAPSLQENRLFSKILLAETFFLEEVAS